MFNFILNDRPANGVYTLSLHDALPISVPTAIEHAEPGGVSWTTRKLSPARWSTTTLDRKSTRLNSSHVSISYAVFCLKKKSAQGTARVLDGHGRLGNAGRGRPPGRLAP